MKEQDAAGARSPQASSGPGRVKGRQPRSGRLHQAGGALRHLGSSCTKSGADSSVDVDEPTLCGGAMSLHALLSLSVLTAAALKSVEAMER